MFTKLKKSGETGASLIETMIAIGILGVAIGTAMTYFAQTGSTVRGENAKEVQQLIATRIQLALANPEAMSKTVNMLTGSENKRLKACAIGADAKEGLCTGANTVAAAREFELADAVVAADGSAVKLSGPTVGWTKDGKTCTVGTPTCVFTARTKFWATCKPAGNINAFTTSTPPNSCVQAQYLNFKFLVSPASQVNKKSGVKLYPYPSAAAYNGSDTTGSIRMRAADVVLRQGGDCGDPKNNLRMVGIDSDGRPLCKCIDGSSPPTSGKNKGICQDQPCPAGKLMVGFKEAPGTGFLVPECLDQKSCEDPVTFDQKCPCKIIDLAPPVQKPDSGDCGVGFWMVHVSYGECKATTDKDGKAAPETVKCSEHTAKCCKTDAK